MDSDVNNVNDLEKLEFDAAERVLNYIQQHVKDGRVTASLRDISEATGVKYQTVPRALQRLEAKNIIKLMPRKRHNDPNIIQLVSEVTPVDFLKSRTLIKDLLSELEHAEAYIVKLEQKVADLERKSKKLAELEDTCKKLQEASELLQEGEIISVQDMPGARVVLIRKGDVAGGSAEASSNDTDIKQNS